MKTNFRIKYGFLFLLLAIALNACSNDSSKASKYLRWVGDSKFDENLDDPNFKICGSESLVKQYFHLGEGLQFQGEKKELVRQFMTNYKAVDRNESGWIRIRFIVNCNGNTGRFRVTEADENYQTTEFNDQITNQLLSILKGLNGWQNENDKNAEVDYYQYLVFKIKNGNLVEIMP